MLDLGQPIGREGDRIAVTTLAGLGDDPAGKRPRNALYLAERYEAIDALGVPLVLASDEGEEVKEYRGVAGLVDLIRDWLFSIRRAQTAAAAEKVRGTRRKKRYPKFYRELSDAEKKRFLRDFGGGEVSVRDLEIRYGVERTTLYRAEEKAYQYGEHGRLGLPGHAAKKEERT